MKKKLLILSSVGICLFLVACIASVVQNNVLGKSGLTSDFGKSATVRDLDENSIESLVNVDRQKQGLPALKHSELLRESACDKLADMVQKGYWAHTSPTGKEPWYFITQVGYIYNNAGENLAYDQYSETEVVDDWMASKGHRDNMLGSYTEQGICSIKAEYLGKDETLTVQHLATPR
jgi:uncharacterized protein YkwD